MTTGAAIGVKPVREGFRTITPYVIVNEAPELIDFLKQAFGAEELSRNIGSAGGLHCELKIGDSMIMVGGGLNWRGTPSVTAFHLEVDDVDAVYRHAVEAGAAPIQPPADQDYGSRGGSVTDLSGNRWYISTLIGPREGRSPNLIPASHQTLVMYLHAQSGVEMIDFLKNAFGASESYKAQSPDGNIHHARLRVGSSDLELSDANGVYQPMPSTVYVYTDDCDALYGRALKAGSTSLYPPADQPYGDRNAGVRDPFGNTWYLATHVKDAQP
jgi:PhnB protein